MEQKLLTLSDVANIAKVTANCVYQHYYRGHLRKYPINSHKLYFEWEDVVEFLRQYYPNSLR